MVTDTNHDDWHLLLMSVVEVYLEHSRVMVLTLYQGGGRGGRAPPEHHVLAAEVIVRENSHNINLYLSHIKRRRPDMK